MDNIRVTLAVHWEGRHLDGVQALADARARLLPGVPVTHFVSAAYFARGGNLERVVEAMLPAFDSHDEIALHLPAWQSLRGSGRGPEHTVVLGEDPELDIEYEGISPQVDRGYTHPICAYPRPAIEAAIVNSKLLLRPLLQRVIDERKVQVERVLRGIRAGHGMASDVFLASACNTGFVYDASAMDSVWARNAVARAEAESERGLEAFSPLWRHWQRLWGSEAQAEPYLSNAGMLKGTGGAGINAATQPFFIARCGASRLLELPLGGGVIPPARPQHVAELLANTLDAPPGMPRVVSLAIRQETAEGSLDALLRAEALRSARIRWTTNVDLLPVLLGTDAVPEPPRVSPLQELRQQMPLVRPPGSAPMPPPSPAIPTPAAPPVVIPPIQIPPLRT